MKTVWDQKFTPKESEVTTSSGRVFKFQELNGYQQLQADSCSETISGAMYYRMVQSLISLEGSPFRPVHKKVDLDARLALLRGSEADELAIAYAKAFSASGEELKNESTPPHEESSSN